MGRVVVNVDGTLANADWPKRTPDRRADLEGPEPAPPSGPPAARAPGRPAAVARSTTLRAYDDDQPRDEGGRWTSGGGGGAAAPAATGYLERDSPEVKAAAGRLRGAAERSEPKITADMRALEEVSGGKLIGLDFRLKSEGSLARKLATDPDYVEQGLTLEEREARVKDSVRYTLELDEENYASGAQAAIDAARAQGYDVTTSNAWARGEGYAGYHATLRAEGQPAVELQFHTAASFTAKEIGNPEAGIPASHVLYEALREETNPGRVAELKGQIAALWAPVRAGMPAGALSMP